MSDAWRNKLQDRTNIVNRSKHAASHHVKRSLICIYISFDIMVHMVIWYVWDQYHVCVCVIVVVYSMALGPCNNLWPYRSLGNIYQIIYLLHCRTSCRGLTDWRNNEHANSFVGHIFIAQTSAQIAACLAAVDSRCRFQQWLAFEKPEKCTFALETERNHTRSQTRH